MSELKPDPELADSVATLLRLVSDAPCDLCAGDCRHHSLGDEWVPEEGSRAWAEDVLRRLLHTRNERDAFVSGYLIAISTTLHQHDCPVTAEDAIRDAGFTLADAKRVGLDDFDMKVLRPIFANIKRRDKLAAAKEATDA